MTCQKLKDDMIESLENTILKHISSFPKKRHGSVVPHWKAARHIENTVQSPMKLASARPRLRWGFEAVRIMSSEMIDNFANPKVAI